MNILHLTDNLPPRGGGLERAVATLAGHWASTGHTPVIMTGRAEGEPAEEEQAGVRIIRTTSTFWQLPGSRPTGTDLFFPPVKDPALGRRIEHVAQKYDIDVVHSHSWIGAAGRGALSELPTLYGHHDAGHICARKSLVDHIDNLCPGPSAARCTRCAAARYGPVRGCTLAAAVAAGRTGRHAEGGPRSRGTAGHAAPSAHVAVSETLAAALAVTGIHAEVVPTFIPDSLIRAAQDAPKPPWAPDGPYLIHTGQISVHKGSSTVIAAHRLLLETGHDAELLLVGPVKPDMGDIMTGLGPRVRAVGPKPHSQLLGAIRHADMLLAPSVFEAFGQVAAEALACSTPVIVTSRTGLADIVEHGIHGLHVPAGNPEKLAEAVKHLAERDDIRTRVRHEGPQVAGRLTVSSTAPRIMSIYRQLTGAGRES